MTDKGKRKDGGYESSVAVEVFSFGYSGAFWSVSALTILSPGLDASVLLA